MRFDLNSVKQDPVKRSDGVWVDLVEGARIHVASLTSEAFQAWFRKKTAPYTKMGRDVPADVQRGVMLEGIVKFVLLDWEGIYENDVLLPFSEENAKRVLTEVDWFLERVLEESRNIANFVADVAEDVAKN